MGTDEFVVNVLSDPKSRELCLQAAELMGQARDLEATAGDALTSKMLNDGVLALYALCLRIEVTLDGPSASP